MLLRKIVQRASRMCPLAYRVQRFSVILACVQLSAALMLLLRADTFSVHTYRSFRLVYTLLENSSAVLLVGVIGAVCIEDRLQ